MRLSTFSPRKSLYDIFNLSVQWHGLSGDHLLHSSTHCLFEPVINCTKQLVDLVVQGRARTAIIGRKKCPEIKPSLATNSFCGLHTLLTTQHKHLEGWTWWGCSFDERAPVPSLQLLQPCRPGSPSPLWGSVSLGPVPAPHWPPVLGTNDFD